MESSRLCERLLLKTIIYRNTFANAGIDSTSTRFSTVTHNDFPYTIAPDNQAWGADELKYQQPFPVTGKLTKMRVKLSGSPGSGKSFTFDIRVGAATPAGTLSVTISDTNTTGTDLVNQLNISSGDLVSIRCVPTNSPTARAVQITMIYETTGQRSIVLGGGDSIPNNSRFYNLAVGGLNTVDIAIVRFRQSVFPTSGTLRNLYVYAWLAPTAGKTIPCTIFKNGSATALTTTIPALGNTASNTSDTVSVSAGDIIYFEGDLQTSAVSGTGISYGYEFVPTTPGESLFLNNNTSNPSTSIVEHSSPAVYAATSTWGTNGTARRVVTDSATISKMYVSIDTAPGASKSFKFDLAVNSVASTLSVTISGSDTSGNDLTHQVVVLAGDELGIISTPTNSPASPGRVRIAMVTVAKAGNSGLRFFDFFEPSGGNSRKGCRV